jgi:hypothetical protein
MMVIDRLCGLAVRVSGYRSRDPDFLTSSSLSLLTKTEKLLEIKVAIPV